MDVGVFLRSKTRLRMWILVPPAVLFLLVGGGAWYCSRADRTLRWQGAFLESVPELRVMLQNALSMTSNSYLTARSTSEARENLNALFNDVARQSGFTINSLGIEESAGARKELRATVKGEGTLDLILRFIEAAERPANLVTLDAATMTVMQPRANPSFQVQMMFLYAYSPK
jgi:hypothetical protein